MRIEYCGYYGEVISCGSIPYSPKSTIVGRLGYLVNWDHMYVVEFGDENKDDVTVFVLGDFKNMNWVQAKWCRITSQKTDKIKDSFKDV